MVWLETDPFKRMILSQLHKRTIYKSFKITERKDVIDDSCEDKRLKLTCHILSIGLAFVNRKTLYATTGQKIQFDWLRD